MVGERNFMRAYSGTPLQVNATFGFFAASPSAGALVFACVSGGGQWLVANAGVALVVQRIVGDVVFEDVCPDVFSRPVCQRVYFESSVFVALEGG